MADIIEHDGIVEGYEGKRVRVRIVQQSACAGCHARSMCSAGESAVKEIIAIPMEAMQVGDKVIVSVEQKLGWKAVLLAFLIPLGILMALLFIGQRYWAEPGWLSGTIALAALAPYYIVLHQFEGKFEREYLFRARKGTTTTTTKTKTKTTTTTINNN